MSRALITLSGKLTETQYRYIHQWVESLLGKPKRCENCETTVSSYYDWANISGEYKQKLSDWVRLCRHCHRLLDKRLKTHCKRGHEFTPENTYLFAGETRTCRKCNVIRVMKVYHNKKAKPIKQEED